MTGPEPIILRQIRRSDKGPMSRAFGRPEELFGRYLQEMESGARDVIVAAEGGTVIGYLTVVWESHYRPFREKRIPEIMDLNVLPHHRGRGIGSRLLDEAEGVARQRSDIVGIGVGLYSGYGVAQRIYARRGYVPDGRGVVYDGRPVAPGSYIRVDDSLTLQLVKRFVGS
jgi:GNAT superfamily N-acetyltransferase